MTQGWAPQQQLGGAGRCYQPLPTTRRQRARRCRPWAPTQRPEASTADEARGAAASQERQQRHVQHKRRDEQW